MPPADKPTDERFMAEALELACHGLGLASPNPCVGAVVVAGGEVIGRGSHTYEVRKHAEILALEAAGARAREATLYLTLEPCCHTGRTGPCLGEVLRAGVRRVVVAMLDPNPAVHGRGVAGLQQAGVAVTTGVLEKEARKLNEAFAKHIRTGLPLVTLKAGMTLDGKIAPPGNPAARGVTGGWITSAEARAHVQQLRHASDAIMVGVGTVIADDPLLTDRSGLPRRRPLLRVILDSRLRLPLPSRLVRTCQNDVLVFCSFAEEKKRRALEQQGVRVEQIPLGEHDDGRPDLRQVARHLGALDLTSVLIEGGALVNWAALAAGIVDKVFLYYAPKILAGAGAVPFAAGSGFGGISEAAQVHDLELHRFGEDFAVEGYLRDPYTWQPLPPTVVRMPEPVPELPKEPA